MTAYNNKNYETEVKQRFGNDAQSRRLLCEKMQNQILSLQKEKSKLNIKLNLDFWSE